MAETRSSDTVIFKILNGTQSGVEVSLVAGEYGLGTGPDDDIQLIDVSIKPSHARLRVSAGKIELAGSMGTLRTAAGVHFEANGEWQEIQPLDVVTAGTTRFALGHPTSQWATIVEDEGDANAAGVQEPSVWQGRLSALNAGRVRAVAIPLLAVCLLLGFAVWFVFGGSLNHLAGRMEHNADDLAVTREALDQFSFGRPIKAHQEVDGVVYVNGYVETPVERRALTAAIEKTGVPAKVRLWVLQNIRNEVESLIASQKVPVTFQVASDGRLTLDGLILNEAQASRFVDLVKDRVLGVSEITSRIRTSATLLAEVEKLAVATQIQPFVLLRVNNDLIEANGAIPAEKVDAFVGFLQSYARRFAREIALRSFVQLQGPGGKTGEQGVDRAIILGGTVSGGDVALDADRLTRGTYKLGDIFPGAGSGGGGSGAGGGGAGVGDIGRSAPLSSARPGSDETGGSSQSAPPKPVSAAERPSQDNPAKPAADDAARSAQTASTAPQTKAGPSQVPGVLAGAPVGNSSAATDAALAAIRARARRDVLPASTASPAAGELKTQGRQLLERWRHGRLGDDAKTKGLQSALETLRDSDPDSDAEAVIPTWYLPLLTDGSEENTASACWPGTQIRARDALAALFWLDLMSTSEGASLSGFSREVQLLLLEVALNPTRVADCTTRSAETAQAASKSIYLREIRRNPSFVRFIVRDLAPFTLDITGANLMEARFIVTRAGRKMYEGSAPDQSSRVALIGELGVAVQLKSGLAAVIFESDMSWKITQ